jgi:hypothetical protein
LTTQPRIGRPNRLGRTVQPSLQARADEVIRGRKASKMDSFTVPPELKGTKGDIIAARIEVPILVVMIYGIVEFVRLGWSQDHYLYTYAPVLGGVSASVGLFTYFFLVSAERKSNRKNLLVLFGFLPYFYALYIMGVLGLYTIYEGVTGKFSFWSMIGGVFWVFLGFHLIYRFYLMTEIVRQHDEKTKFARACKID